jgi:hypothetical protein
MRPPLPRQMQIRNVALGTQAGGSAGTYALADARQVVARIDGDTSDVFRIIRIETDEVVKDPNGPHGGIDVLETVSVVQGPGPIDVDRGQALQVFVEFSCPADPPQAVFKATAVVEGSGLSIAFPILAVARLGSLQAVAVTNPSMLPGSQPLAFDVRIFSSLGHEVTIAIDYDTPPEPTFTAPTQFPPPIPAGGVIDVPVFVSCAPETTPGQHPVSFKLRAVDGTASFGFLLFTITVRRAVTVVTNLPDKLAMQPGDVVRGELRVTVPGGPAQLEVAHGPLPAGISVRPDSQRFAVDGSIFVGFDIEASPAAAPHPSTPLQIFWTVTEPEITDQVVVNIEIVPDVQEIIYDSGTLEALTVRGWAQLAIHRNGDWFFRGHVHENGVVGDNYAFAIALNPIDTNSDLHYAIQQGTLGGTVDPFEDRDDDWQQPTGNDPAIAANWNAIRLRGSSAFRSVLHASTDVAQVFEAVLEALTIGVIVAAGAAVVGFLTSPTTRCQDPQWQVGNGEEAEGVKEIDPGGGMKVRCEGR